jgi:hypothetical protein
MSAQIIIDKATESFRESLKMYNTPYDGKEDFYWEEFIDNKVWDFEASLKEKLEELGYYV